MSSVDIPAGKSVCGCGGCKEVFTCLSAFDRHQTLRPADQGGGVICHEPSSRGLELYERSSKGEEWALWGWPASADDDDSWYEAGDK